MTMTNLRKLLIMPFLITLYLTEIALGLVVGVVSIASAVVSCVEDLADDLAGYGSYRIGRAGRRLLDWASKPEK